MAARKKIGRGTWIDKLASEMMDRERALGRDSGTVRVESGLGASGIPHVGSLGDAVRAYGVKLAVQDMGYDSELIAYSDDMDGLRKIPEGFPESLKEHIARPVSMIPDPLGCHDSYGQHMSSLLLEGLDALGISYEFRRAKDVYASGALAEQAHKILVGRQRIGQAIMDMTGQEKFQSFLPYFAVCEQCGRLYTAESHGYDEDRREVAYRCADAEIGGQRVPGCGHSGRSRIGKDMGKLAWKAEFAARWAAFGIRFEAYGKDIMDSVRVNDWVAENVLGYAPPYHVKYEMFLDKGGKKISKSLGNVVTAQNWLKYGTPQSLLLLLYKRITGARELGLDDVPGLVEEFHELERAYFAPGSGSEKEDRQRGLYEYVRLLEPPQGPAPYASYRLLAELCRVFREDRAAQVGKKLLEYGTVKEIAPEIESMIALAGNYADDFAAGQPAALEADAATKEALLSLAGALESGKCEDIQGSIFGAARDAGIKPRDFFGSLYGILLGASRGPRLGPFISDMGQERAAQRIREAAS